VRTAVFDPNFEALYRRIISWRQAQTTKYSCFKRSSLPSKNWNICYFKNYVSTMEEVVPKEVKKWKK